MPFLISIYLLPDYAVHRPIATFPAVQFYPLHFSTAVPAVSLLCTNVTSSSTSSRVFSLTVNIWLPFAPDRISGIRSHMTISRAYRSLTSS